MNNIKPKIFGLVCLVVINSILLCPNSALARRVKGENEYYQRLKYLVGKNQAEEWFSLINEKMPPAKKNTALQLLSECTEAEWEILWTLDKNKRGIVGILLSNSISELSFTDIIDKWCELSNEFKDVEIPPRLFEFGYGPLYGLFKYTIPALKQKFGDGAAEFITSLQEKSLNLMGNLDSLNYKKEDVAYLMLSFFEVTVPNVTARLSTPGELTLENFNQKIDEAIGTFPALWESQQGYINWRDTYLDKMKQSAETTTAKFFSNVFKRMQLFNDFSLDELLSNEKAIELKPFSIGEANYLQIKISSPLLTENHSSANNSDSSKFFYILIPYDFNPTDDSFTFGDDIYVAVAEPQNELPNYMQLFQSISDDIFSNAEINQRAYESARANFVEKVKVLLNRINPNLDEADEVENYKIGKILTYDNLEEILGSVNSFMR
jgi:hypothetical protein